MTDTNAHSGTFESQANEMNAGGKPIVVEASPPTFKEQVAGHAKAIRGQITGNKQLQAEGEQMLQGVNTPSTNAKVQQQTGQTLDSDNVHIPTGGMKGTPTEGKI